MEFCKRTIEKMYRGCFGLLAVIVILIPCHSLPQNPAMAPYLGMAEDMVDSKEHGVTGGSQSTNCPCGWTNKVRIVGGVETQPNEYPFMVGIKLRDDKYKEETFRGIFCGGALITDRYVATAAHCFDDYPDSALSVVLAQHDQSKDMKESGAVAIDVAQSIKHEQYDPEGYHFDIALLVLSRKVIFNQKIGPVCMPPGRLNLLNEQLKVLGWGKLGDNLNTSQVLMKTNLKVIPIKVCDDSHSIDIETKEPYQLCTFLFKKDSCQGDSGGPLVWLDPATNRYTLVGVVSFGLRCGKRSPSVNSDVSYFLDWINAKIKATDTAAVTCARI